MRAIYPSIQCLYCLLLCFYALFVDFCFLRTSNRARSVVIEHLNTFHDNIQRFYQLPSMDNVIRCVHWSHLHYNLNVWQLFESQSLVSLCCLENWSKKSIEKFKNLMSKYALTWDMLMILCVALLWMIVDCDYDVLFIIIMQSIATFLLWDSAASILIWPVTCTFVWNSSSQILDAFRHGMLCIELNWIAT